MHTKLLIGNKTAYKALIGLGLWIANIQYSSLYRTLYVFFVAINTEIVYIYIYIYIHIYSILMSEIQYKSKEFSTNVRNSVQI